MSKPLLNISFIPSCFSMHSAFPSGSRLLKVSTYLWLVLVFISLSGLAQNVKKPFYYSLTEYDGLPSNNVYDIIKDKNGYIWAATEKGLARYDGQTFTHFKIEDKAYKNDVVNVEMDHLGRIWFLDYSRNVGYVENGVIHTILNAPAKIPQRMLFDFHIVSSKTKSFVLTNNYIIEISDQNQVIHPIGHGWIIGCEMRGDTLIVLERFEKNEFVLKNDQLEIIKKQVIDTVHGINAIIRDGKISNFSYPNTLILEGTSSRIPPIDRGFSISSVCYDSMFFGCIANLVFVKDNDDVQWYDLGKNITTRNILRLPNGTYLISTNHNGICVLPSLYMQSTVLYKSNNHDEALDKIMVGSKKVYIATKNLEIAEVKNFKILEPILTFRLMDNHNYKVLCMQEITYSPPKYIFVSQHSIIVRNGKQVDLFYERQGDIKDFTSFSDGYLSGESFGVYFITSKNRIRITDSRVYKLKNTEYEAWVSQESGVYSIAPISFKLTQYDIPSFLDLVALDATNRLLITETGSMVKYNTKSDSKYEYPCPITNASKILYHKSFVYLFNNKRIEKFSINVTTGKLTQLQTFVFKLNFGDRIADVAIANDSFYICTTGNIFKISEKDLFVRPLSQNFYLGFINAERKGNNWVIDEKTEMFKVVFTDYLLGMDSFYYTFDGTNGHSVSNVFQTFGLKEGAYKLVVGGRDIFGNVVKEQSYNIIKRVPFIKSTIFNYSVIGTLAALILFFIIAAIRYKQSLQQEIMMARISEGESRLTALRAQINPHFVHNALNSIMAIMLQNNISVATKSISQFSKLFRYVLTSTKYATHSISNEVNILKNYIELEQLRFDEKFTYSIKVNPEKLLDEEIPTGMLQPLVENAIWHGLLNSEAEEKSLKVSFNEVDKAILITVEDDGAGYIEAESEDSMAIKNIKERLVLMDNLLKWQISFSIKSKDKSTKNTRGTICQIKIKK